MWFITCRLFCHVSVMKISQFRRLMCAAVCVLCVLCAAVCVLCVLCAAVCVLCVCPSPCLAHVSTHRSRLLRVTRTALIQEKSERGRLSQKAEEKREEPCGCTEEPQTSDAESRRAARGL